MNTSLPIHTKTYALLAWSGDSLERDLAWFFPAEASGEIEQEPIAAVGY
jgi:hypothetical protein